MKTIQAVQGSLKHLRTETSRRRFPAFNDDGRTMLSGYSPFVRDEITLLGSKAMRRLADKPQVTCFPGNPYIRNRASHTNEVVGCSINISEILGLETNLTRAIAFGHDIGHVPFGHIGERYLAERTGKKFTHEVMGVVITQFVERRGRGLNLTHEVLEGMLRHSGANAIACMTPEAWVVRYADKIAYLFADFNDFCRMQYPLSKDLTSLMNEFGDSQRERVRRTILALCQESAEKGKVSFDDCDLAEKFKELRVQMYKVYPLITAQDPRHILDKIYAFIERLGVIDPWLAIALMTDSDIDNLSQQYLLSFEHFKATAVGELIDYLKDLKVDCFNPDLDW